MTITELEKFYVLLERVFPDIIEPKISYRDSTSSGSSGANRGMNIVDRKLNLYFSIKAYRKNGDSRMYEDALADYNWFIENYPFLQGRIRNGKRNKEVTTRNRVR